MNRLLSLIGSRAAVRLGLDLVALVGLGMIGTGLWMIFPPVALIVVGTVLLAGAVYGSWITA